MGNTFTVAVQVELPDAQRIEEIIREEAARVAGAQLAWLSFAEAAKYWGVSKRTFERKKKRMGLPVSEIDGIKRIARCDLDAALRANLKLAKVSVIPFPSVAMRDGERESGKQESRKGAA